MIPTDNPTPEQIIREAFKALARVKPSERYADPVATACFEVLFEAVRFMDIELSRKAIHAGAARRSA